MYDLELRREPICPEDLRAPKRQTLQNDAELQSLTTTVAQQPHRAQ